MTNSFLIDYLLSAMLLVWLVLAYRNVRHQLSDLNERISRHAMATAINSCYKFAMGLSVLPISILCFLMWRLVMVLIATQTWGQGAFGLVVVLSVYGIGVSLLQCLLFVIRYSGFASAPTSPTPINTQSNQSDMTLASLLATNKPMQMPNVDNGKWG